MYSSAQGKRKGEGIHYGCDLISDDKRVESALTSCKAGCLTLVHSVGLNVSITLCFSSLYSLRRPFACCLTVFHIYTSSPHRVSECVCVRVHLFYPQPPCLPPCVSHLTIPRVTFSFHLLASSDPSSMYQLNLSLPNMKDTREEMLE